VAKGGFVLGLVVSSGVEITDFIFNDEKTMCDLVGGIGVEAVKAGLGALTGFAVAAALTFTGIAVLPLAGMLAVSFLVGVGLNELDNAYAIKQRVVTAMKAAPDNLAAGYYIVKQSSLLLLHAMSGSIRIGDRDALQRLDLLVKDAIRQLSRR
jgi:hypothetical protein